MSNKMPIPNDWTEENGYAIAVVCFPNSLQWRINLRGAIYALTRGRNYDFSTGVFRDIEQLANDLEDSFMACDFQTLIDKADDLIKTQRMIVAALMGQSINFDSEPLPNAINYEPGIIGMLTSISTNIDDNMTLQELKDLVDGLDLTGTTFLDNLTDIAQILTFLILLWGPTQKVKVAFDWWDKFAWKRYQHNQLSLSAHQATSLRGIMRAIAPFREEDEAEEKSLLDNLYSIPWLAKAIVAIAEPSPVGEISLISTTISGVIGNLFTLIKTAWETWWNKWINLVEEPEPMDNIVSALSVIAHKIATREDESESPGISIVNRLDVLATAISNLDPSEIIPVLDAIENVLGGDYEPGGGP